MGFEFKQFYIEDDLCGQKVCTDSILLGSWTPIIADERVLDIGSGSGLLSIMLAQRTAGEVSVDAVELDINACQQANTNVANSPWSDAVSVYNQDINQFVSDTGYDLIITNPPYFNSSLKGHNRARNQARHSDDLSFEQLLACVERNLADNGRFCVVLPTVAAEQLKIMAKGYHLEPIKCLAVKTLATKQAKLQLMCFVQDKAAQKLRHNPQIMALIDGQLIIHNSIGDYSSQFIALTREFYLNR